MQPLIGKHTLNLAVPFLIFLAVFRRFGGQLYLAFWTSETIHVDRYNRVHGGHAIAGLYPTCCIDIYKLAY